MQIRFLLHSEISSYIIRYEVFMIYFIVLERYFDWNYELLSFDLVNFGVLKTSSEG